MDVSQTERVLSDFAGHWHYERDIHHADGGQATAQGTADWTLCAQGMLYTEAGELQIAGQAKMRTERRYVWGPDLVVHFEDGRFFHSVPPRGGETVHDCPPDTYRVVYRFAQWPRFETVWRVTGPRKDYTMVTRYWRA